MIRTSGIVTESSGRNCRLCRKNHDYYYNIFTSNVACNIAVKDALHALVGLNVAVGDGLPTTMCPLCWKKLTEFSVFKKICLESDAVLRKSVQSNCCKSFEEQGVGDDSSGPSVETKGCTQDVIENNSQRTCSAQTTEIYLPVPDLVQPGDNELLPVKEENEGNYRPLYASDPGGISTDASDPLATDDLSDLATYKCSSVKNDQISDDDEGHVVNDCSDGATSKQVHQNTSNQFNLKEEDEDPLSRGNYSVMHSTDPAIKSTDVSDPLATDDWAQASTSSQGEVVDSNGKETIVIDLDSLLVLAKEDLSPKETEATEPTVTENGNLVENGTMAMDSMTEAVELAAPERASAFFALLEPKIGASRSRKGKKVEKETLSIGKDMPLKSLASRRETVSSSQPTSSKSLNQLLCKRQVVGQKGNRLLKENLGGTRQKKNVRQARIRFILDGKSCTGSRNIAKKSYSCHGYEKSFSQKSNLVHDIRTNTKEKPYSCNDCDKSFSQKSDLVRHIRCHTKEKPYSCNECEKYFSRKSNLVCHIRTHTKVKPYPCNECGKSFSTKGSLVIHIRTHTKEKPFPCNDCGKSFSLKGNLVRHIRTHTKERPYPCHECEKSFSQKQDLVSHIRSHTKEKPYSCNKCDKSFSLRCNLVHHIRTHTNEKPFPCNECGMSFSLRGNLVHHMRTHTKERPYPCNECEKSFSQKSTLVNHMWTHTKEKPYPCNECEKSFSRKCDLVFHIQTHRKEKSYSCGECVKSFSRKSSLVIHIRSHMKERPYPCNECEKSFSRKCDLEYHIRTHRKEKSYSCSECEKSFYRKNSLVIHIRTHTK